MKCRRNKYIAQSVGPLMYLNLDNLRLLSRNSDSFICEILKVYIENTPIDLERMEAAVSDENWKVVQYYAHKLKSSAFTIGFLEGHGVFQEIEHKLRHNEVDSSIAELYTQAAQLSKLCMTEAEETLVKFS